MEKLNGRKNFEYDFGTEGRNRLTRDFRSREARENMPVNYSRLPATRESEQDTFETDEAPRGWCFRDIASDIVIILVVGVLGWLVLEGIFWFEGVIHG